MPAESASNPFRILVNSRRQAREKTNVIAMRRMNRRSRRAECCRRHIICVFCRALFLSLSLPGFRADAACQGLQPEQPLLANANSVSCYITRLNGGPLPIRPVGSRLPRLLVFFSSCCTISLILPYRTCNTRNIF